MKMVDWEVSFSQPITLLQLSHSPDSIQISDHWMPVIKESLKMKFESSLYFHSHQVNVKLGLCVSSCYSMKTYCLLNWAKPNEDVWGGGSLAPGILNLDKRW